MVLLTGSLLAQKPAAKKVESPKYSCVAGPEEVCASDLWYADYMKWKALQAKYAVPQEVADQLRGMAIRLSESVPAGMRWDEAKQRFVKAEQPKPPKVEEKK